ncbi:hypothetical protein [Bacteroides heparinolyticus]|uniref:hypothetical protein n=1 Tax=Prevotella heparinolytica TaxID=28113 RepID=UPI003AEFC427
MIVTTDIANILFRDCKSFGIKTVPFGKTITGELKEECITIHVKGQTSGTYWEKCFVEVNLCVPNLRDGEANTIRLNEIERLAKGKFKEDVVSDYNNTSYRYAYETISIERDDALKCCFVNCRLLFNVFNTN